jgi:hypothetical protein
MSTPAITPDNKTMSAEEAFARIQALRDIQRETGCITRRAQSYLLASLADTVLSDVAFRLKYPSLYGDKK